MRKSIFGRITLAAVLLLAISTGSAMACNYIGMETRSEYWGVTTVGSDCYFDATPNAMVTYFKYDKEYHVNRYKVYQCPYGLSYVFDGLVYIYHNQCWSPTTTHCVGNKDWEPSPQC
jgi:hypothetical protein